MNSHSLLNPQRTDTLRLWQRVVLGAILLLAVVLHFFRLDQEGFANLYYAATVKSMLTSWQNFFFASFDPGGFVSVDKPPLGFWIQALSATLFGFSGVSLILPQALAGVLSVALLYYLVKRVFGVTAGLVAALALTVTPISIAANRNNTMDSLLVLTSLIAAWAVSIAAETGRLRWLIVCALFVGIGFNIKMLQAVMVLPAFFLVYLVAARAAWWKRIAHLAIATMVLGVVSLVWIVAVDLTPPDQRPFVGSSHNNTEMELIVGHNGLARLGQIASWLGIRAPQPAPPGDQPNPPLNAQTKAPLGNPPNPPPPNQRGQPPPAQPNPPGGNDETGQAGLLRLFNKQLAGQASWLLPLALLGFIAAAWQTRVRVPFAHEHQALLLWGLWLAPQVAFFSYAGLFHRYYLEMLSPAIAALVGAGVAAMWRDYQAHRWRGWLLPLVILISAIIQAAILTGFPDWAKWLIPIVGGLGLIGALGLFILKLRPARGNPLFAFAFLLLALLALLLTPTAWSFTPVLNGGDSGLPFASPDLLRRPNRPANNLPADARLIEVLRANRGGARFLAATVSAQSAAPIILATGSPVMALGGFSGSDKILSVDQLAERVARNDVRFFLLQPNDQQAELTRWVAEHCANVSPPAPSPNRAPGALNPAAGEQKLYDCGKAR